MKSGASRRVKASEPEICCLTQDFYKFLKDDRLLLQAAGARWTLVPSKTNSLYHSSRVDGTPQPHGDEPELTTHLGKGTHIHGLRIAFPEEAVEICPQQGCTIGRGVDSHIRLDNPAVSPFLSSRSCGSS